MPRHLGLGMLLLAALFALPAIAQDDAKTHFAFAGPLKELVLGGKIAPIRNGLEFRVVLADQGKKIGESAFELKVPGADKPLKLTLDGLAFSNGHLTAQAKVTNGTGAAVEGVRLDVTEVTETYRPKDEQGKEVLRMRAQPASLASPLLFGDLGDTEGSGGFAFDVSPIVFAPETTEIVVRGVVSGLRFVKLTSLGEVTTYQADVDAKGRVYVSAGDVIKTFDPATGAVGDFVKLEHNSGVAVDRATGDILTVAGNNTLLRYGSNGAEKMRWDAEKNELEWLTLGVRVDSKGRIYNSGDNQRALQCISSAGKKLWKVEAPESQQVLFDVDEPGNCIYVATARDQVLSYDLNGAKSRPFAAGNDWHLGKIINPVSVRLDTSNAQIAIVEGGRGMDEEKKLTEEDARISVFDRSGAFVRMWGRGGKVRVAESGALPGQVYRPGDLVYGPAGAVYVVCERPGENGRFLMTFQAF